jgi:hypothetical protein
MKSYQKRKAKPNSPGPGFRTSKNFRSKYFGKKNAKAAFNPASFKTQHRG